MARKKKGQSASGSASPVVVPTSLDGSQVSTSFSEPKEDVASSGRLAAECSAALRDFSRGAR